ncbi:MAG: sugar ABC transporter permease [Chloroflexi bacterium]|nr:sugar ABC transporter permease [Chloroflexota bacterium]
MNPPSRLRRMTLRQREVLASLGFVLPSILIIAAVSVFPIVATFVLSFTETKIAELVPRDFVGLSNYAGYLSNATFWDTIGRTSYFTFVSVGVELLLGLAIAVLIQSHPPGWRFLRLSLIIPWAVPTIVNGALWRWIYNADYGALNALLVQSGLVERYIPWLTRPFLSLNLVILADIWHSVPFVALILQAALATIPDELEEAAAVDGATAWQRFLHVRLPLLRAAILVVLVIRTVEAFRVFDIVYVITQGGPAFGTVTISYLTYLETFSYGNLGKGSSLSFLISIFTLIMALFYFRIFYRSEPRS